MVVGFINRRLYDETLSVFKGKRIFRLQQIFTDTSHNPIGLIFGWTKSSTQLNLFFVYQNKQKQLLLHPPENQRLLERSSKRVKMTIVPGSVVFPGELFSIN